MYLDIRKIPCGPCGPVIKFVICSNSLTVILEHSSFGYNEFIITTFYAGPKALFRVFLVIFRLIAPFLSSANRKP